MSLEENKILIRRHFEEIWNQYRLDVVEELVSPEYHSHYPIPGQPEGIEGFIYAVRAIRNAFPDMVITIEDMIAEGDKVAARLIAKGTHLGSLGSTAPTGRQATWTGIRIFRIANGKIAEHWANWDDVSLGRQLGILPPLSS
jgi:steroid delta-isomerase-like uncharacterized protein